MIVAYMLICASLAPIALFVLIFYWIISGIVRRRDEYKATLLAQEIIRQAEGKGEPEGIIKQFRRLK